MDRIIIEGVRCFHSRQSVPLRPITLLVGENSSGKSTFLALTRMAWDICQGEARIEFNQEPFLLGGYDQVASVIGGRKGRVKEFHVGAEFLSESVTTSRHVVPASVSVAARFTPLTHPQLTEWCLEAGRLRVELSYARGPDRPVLTVAAPSGSAIMDDFGDLPPLFPLVQWLGYVLLIGSWRSRDKGRPTLRGDVSESDLRSVSDLASQLRRAAGKRPYAFAPIRTRPQRTYDPLKDEERPEGTHVPMVLANVRFSDPEGWQELRESLCSLGKASGLFRDVAVKRLGGKPSDPFRISVKVSTHAFNLVDVGYGVSQALPIVVDSLRRPSGTTFLLQQPEVHLHPKAQAELASFLAVLAKRDNKRFIIETHSDYIVDRIRADARDHKHLEPRDVAILYFERRNGSVDIHPIQIDDFGNILDPPRGYRRFFLEEETRLLEG
jgi:hypothetical protein